MALNDAVIVLVALAVLIWLLVEQVAWWTSSKKKSAEGFMNASHWHPQISSALLMVGLSLAVSTGGLAADSKSGPPSAPQTQKSGVPKSPGLNAPSPVGTPTLLLPSAAPKISPSPLPDRVPLLPPPGSAPPSADVLLDGPQRRRGNPYDLDPRTPGVQWNTELIGNHLHVVLIANMAIAEIYTYGFSDLHQGQGGLPLRSRHSDELMGDDDIDGLRHWRDDTARRLQNYVDMDLLQQLANKINFAREMAEFAPIPRGRQPIGWGEGPSSDRGRRGGQREVVRIPGGGQQGDPTIGPQPGQGGTLAGQGGRRQGGEGGTLTGRSQKGDGGRVPGLGGWGDGGGVRGGGERSSNNDAPENPPAETRTGQHGGGQTVGPHSQESPPQSRVYGGNEENDSESQTSGGSDTDKKGKVKTGEGLGPSESSGDVKVIPITGLPPADETGGRKGGDDVGGGKLEKYKVKGKTQQEKDLVGPAFGTTTGPDDKERPATGATSGSVSTDPFNSGADDVGGAGLRGRRSGGGQVDVDAGEELLKRLGLWEKMQPGGPDPAK